MRRGAVVLSVCIASVVGSLVSAEVPPTKDPAPFWAAAPQGDRPLVQVALLLDTSNSMDGLINQARTQLWAIVNEIGKSKRDGQVPRLQVALFEYGNDKLSSGEGYVRMVLPFTDNLDDVSEKLFALTTNGGSEFCGQAIQQATTTLSWSNDPKVYKTIFIAGNEPFGQGGVDYHTTVPAAIRSGIVVNTIHCGTRDEGVQGGWADGAKLGEGYFSNIDQNVVVPTIKCPQDERIQKLSVEINVTYVPYGGEGKLAAERQSVQDANASSAPGDAALQRAESKAGSNYLNSTWDLVDAVKEKRVDLATAKDADLPELMRKMNVDERTQYVAEQARKRDAIRTEINQLVAERAKYLAENKPDLTDAEKTLQAAMIESLRDQLKGRHFEVEAK